MPRSTPDRACRVSSRSFIGTVSHCSATLHVCQLMYRPKQFCAWPATSEMEFHPSQTGADHGAVLPLPGCTRSVQTVVCPLEMPSTAPRIRPCGERTLRPPRPRVDDDDDNDTEMNQHRCLLLTSSAANNFPGIFFSFGWSANTFLKTADCKVLQIVTFKTWHV